MFQLDLRFLVVKKMKTVNNFVHSESHSFNSAVRAFLPQYAYIALSQVKGKEYFPVVKENDSVTEGEIIAVDSKDSTGENGAAIHSPLPGKICQITELELPDGKKGSALKIRLVGNFSYLGKSQSQISWKSFSPSALCTTFSKKGVVNTFYQTHPLAEQVKDISSKKYSFVVVRMFDEDPSRMTDSFLAEKYLDQVVEGAYIIAKALDARGIVFALSKNKEYKINFDLLEKMPYMIHKIDTDKYPAGFKHNIVQTLKAQLKEESTDRKKSKNVQLKDNSLFEDVSVKSLFVDPETCFSAMEAVVYGMPVVERFVHVTGDCLRAAAMFKVRLGTTIGNLIEQCGGFKVEPAKIVINGLILGYSVSSFDIPVTKEVKSVEFVPSGQLDDQRFSECIRCGRCRKICPQSLFPDLIYRHSNGGKPVGQQMLETVNLCSACNLCNCVCPSRLPLSQTILSIKEAKNEE